MWRSEGGLYLHCRIYGVLRMLYGMGAIASWPEEATSFQARVLAAPSSAKKRTAAEYQQNPLTFSPNNCCVHPSRSTGGPLSRYTGASVSPLTLRSQPPIKSKHVTVMICH